jgi:transposase
LWEWDDLLAEAASVAGGRRLAAPPPDAARAAQRGGADRLVAGGDRQLARASVWGGFKTGPSPVDRSRAGSKHHLIACGHGTPLAVSLTAANRNDISELLSLIDAIPALRGRRGRPRRRPGKLFGDRAYHSRQARRELRRRGIQAKIARPKSAHNSGLGRERWVVERTIAWLHQQRRLRVRYDRRDDIHEAFLSIACSLICLKQLQAEESFC